MEVANGCLNVRVMLMLMVATDNTFSHVMPSSICTFSKYVFFLASCNVERSMVLGCIAPCHLAQGRRGRWSAGCLFHAFTSSAKL